MGIPRRLSWALAAAVACSAAARADDESTAKLYKSHCQGCHGIDGKSKIPDMNLADGRWKHGKTLPEMIQVIENGVPGKAMIAFKELLTREEIEALARLVQSFARKPKGGGKAPPP
jgi:cytochrome c oxidase cbb3-type subunit 3